MKSIQTIRTCGMAALATAMLLVSGLPAAAQESDLHTIHPARTHLLIASQAEQCRGDRESCIKREHIGTRDLMEYMCGTEERLPREFRLVAAVTCEEEMDIVLMVWDSEAKEPVECMPIGLEVIAMAYAEDGRGRPKRLSLNAIGENEGMLMSVSGRAELGGLSDRLSDSDIFLEMDEPEACVRNFESTGLAGTIGGDAVIEKGKIRLGKPMEIYDGPLFFDR